MIYLFLVMSKLKKIIILLYLIKIGNLKQEWLIDLSILYFNFYRDIYVLHYGSKKMLQVFYESKGKINYCEFKENKDGANSYDDYLIQLKKNRSIELDCSTKTFDPRRIAANLYP